MGPDIKGDLNLVRVVATETVKAGANLALWGAGSVIGSVAATAIPSLRRQRHELLYGREESVRQVGLVAVQSRLEALPPSDTKPAAVTAYNSVTPA